METCDAKPRRRTRWSACEAAGTDLAAAAVVSKGQLYVSNPTNGNITIYPLNANGNLAPTKILGGSATTISFPAGLAVDFAGRIYVADEGPDGGGPGSILVFGAGAAGDVAPLFAIRPTTTVRQTPVGIAVASNGDIWVANFGGASVMKFVAGSIGDVRSRSKTAAIAWLASYPGINQCGPRS